LGYRNSLPGVLQRLNAHRVLDSTTAAKKSPAAGKTAGWRISPLGLAANLNLSTAVPLSEASALADGVVIVLNRAGVVDGLNAIVLHPWDN